MDALEIEVVPNASVAKNWIAHHLEKFSKKRVVGVMHRLAAIFVVSKGDVLQTLENSKICIHLVTELDKLAHLPKVLQLISEGELQLRNHSASSQATQKA